ncbi:glutamyl-tRNA reductase [Corynebacterium sp. 320]|uniref:glutamyl-tRNA reductase n=1 Tax=Corynebacterium TaxID=1716 RepID=UPI00125CCB75|nr:MULTISPECIES: glutamyl-tRNA reductase [Corynebacterium]KAB1504421.1 glutamyl-tRNA reductase [Corynebacterium sp. 320]KAB1552480.1 glutamyl-tRNA reductase [Corynebacterium sp. 321]KAB1554305.1 glutamyl-tRNA reductase [Corynebacterium sp. 319]KAB3528557.1 glutamyl-tRNA reductase [Corynebacterium sp. 250]KAB3539951.1 glutamyl-tRNA reductase [Corynebacterium sp. 366]
MSSSTRIGTGSASVLLVGLSFRSAPVSMLEKVNVADSEMSKLQLALVDNDVISESLVLSTCNRMEFYTVSNAFHSGLDHVVETISNMTGVTAQELEPHLYVHYSNAAAEHMLNVASGLDSMVMGEQQIIGQLRSAYQVADETGTVGRTLHDLTQRALRTGKRVHTETSIDSAGASMVSFAVDRALRFFDSDAQRTSAQRPLEGKRAVIVGAGAMASLASTYVGKLGIDHVTVANRTVARAENLAAHAVEAGVSAHAIGLEGIPSALVDADIVVSATGAVGNVITRAHTEEALRQRSPRPLVMCDLSMPRDVEQAVAELDQVTLLNIEELTTMAGEGVEDEESAREIVARELEEFLEDQRAQAVVPTVKAMRQKAADVVAAELLQLEKHTPGMSELDRREVERTVRRVVDKLLHTPTVQAKRLSADGERVTYTDALAALFNLPMGTVESVTEARSQGAVTASAASAYLQRETQQGEKND